LVGEPWKSLKTPSFSTFFTILFDLSLLTPAKLRIDKL